ncbi:MAG: thioesterase family protein [Alphaproteobacteria bacterium]|nr:thioesterase family protein [Alphaproteobacteria bacterium]
MDTAAIPMPFCEFHSRVEEGWLDFNGHMNVAYYTRAFDDATDLWWTFIGVGPEYVKAKGRSVFAVESHTVYKRELRLGDPIHVTTRLLGFDEKRIHLFFELHHSEKNYLSATQELMAVHVDMQQRAAMPFPENVASRLDEILKVHATHPVPDEAGRGIALRSKRARPSG